MTDLPNRPLFSVLVPAYNAEATILRAANSVIDQGFDSWELIIVDDGSTDKTSQLLSQLSKNESITIVAQENRGTAAALNVAARVASGEFLVQLGADDELCLDYFSTVAAFISAKPDFDIYASNAYRVLADGTRELYQKGPLYASSFCLSIEDLLRASQIYGSAAFRATCFENVGGFDEGSYNEDYGFWLKAMIAGAKHIYIPQPLALYYVSEHQKTQDAIQVRESDATIISEIIESGVLTKGQMAIAKKRVASLQRNIWVRQMASRLLGKKNADRLIAWVSRLARAVRLRVKKGSL